MTEIPTTRKFMFSRSFAEGEGEPKAPVFNEGQMEAARREAFETGYKAGQASTQEEQQARFNQLIEQLATQMESVTDELDDRQETQTEGVADIALALIGRILPAFLRNGAQQEVETLIRDLIGKLSREPHLAFHVPPALCDALQAKLPELTRQASFKGKIEILGDETLALSDCRIQWADGGIERNMEKFWTELDALVEKTTGQPFRSAPYVTPQAASSETDNASKE